MNNDESGTVLESSDQLPESESSPETNQERSALKRRGVLLGGMLGLALGTAVAAVGYIMTYRGALPVLLLVPMLGLALGARIGHWRGYRGTRLNAYVLLLALLLPLLTIAPYEIQGARFHYAKANYVPEFPGAEKTREVMRVLPESGYPGFMAFYQSTAGSEEIVQYMRTGLESEGWEEIDPLFLPGGVMYRFRRPGYRLQLHIARDGHQYSVDVLAFNLVFKREDVWPP